MPDTIKDLKALGKFFGMDNLTKEDAEATGLATDDEYSEKYKEFTPAGENVEESFDGYMGTDDEAWANADIDAEMEALNAPIAVNETPKEELAQQGIDAGIQEDLPPDEEIPQGTTYDDGDDYVSNDDDDSSVETFTPEIFGISTEEYEKAMKEKENIEQAGKRAQGQSYFSEYSTEKYVDPERDKYMPKETYEVLAGIDPQAANLIRDCVYIQNTDSDQTLEGHWDERTESALTRIEIESRQINADSDPDKISAKERFLEWKTNLFGENGAENFLSSRETVSFKALGFKEGYGGKMYFDMIVPESVRDGIKDETKSAMSELLRSWGGFDRPEREKYGEDFIAATETLDKFLSFDDDKLADGIDKMNALVDALGSDLAMRNLNIEDTLDKIKNLKNFMPDPVSRVISAERVTIKDRISEIDKEINKNNGTIKTLDFVISHDTPEKYINDLSKEKEKEERQLSRSVENFNAVKDLSDKDPEWTKMCSRVQNAYFGGGSLSWNDKQLVNTDYDIDKYRDILSKNIAAKEHTIQRIDTQLERNAMNKDGSAVSQDQWDKTRERVSDFKATCESRIEDLKNEKDALNDELKTLDYIDDRNALTKEEITAKYDSFKAKVDGGESLSKVERIEYAALQSGVIEIKEEELSQKEMAVDQNEQKIEAIQSEKEESNRNNDSEIENIKSENSAITDEIKALKEEIEDLKKEAIESESSIQDDIENEEEEPQVASDDDSDDYEKRNSAVSEAQVDEHDKEDESEKSSSEGKTDKDEGEKGKPGYNPVTAKIHIDFDYKDKPDPKFNDERIEKIYKTYGNKWHTQDMVTAWCKYADARIEYKKNPTEANRLKVVQGHIQFMQMGNLGETSIINKIKVSMITGEKPSFVGRIFDKIFGRLLRPFIGDTISPDYKKSDYENLMKFIKHDYFERAFKHEGAVDRGEYPDISIFDEYKDFVDAEYKDTETGEWKSTGDVVTSEPADENRVIELGPANEDTQQDVETGKPDSEIVNHEPDRIENNSDSSVESTTSKQIEQDDSATAIPDSNDDTNKRIEREESKVELQNKEDISGQETAENRLDRGNEITEKFETGKSEQGNKAEDTVRDPDDEQKKLDNKEDVDGGTSKDDDEKLVEQVESDVEQQESIKEDLNETKDVERENDEKDNTEKQEDNTEKDEKEPKDDSAKKEVDSKDENKKEVEKKEDDKTEKKDSDNADKKDNDNTEKSGQKESQTETNENTENLTEQQGVDLQENEAIEQAQSPVDVNEAAENRADDIETHQTEQDVTASDEPATNKAENDDNLNDTSIESREEKETNAVMDAAASDNVETNASGDDDAVETAQNVSAEIADQPDRDKGEEKHALEDYLSKDGSTTSDELFEKFNGNMDNLLDMLDSILKDIGIEIPDEWLQGLKDLFNEINDFKSDMFETIKDWFSDHPDVQDAMDNMSGVENTPAEPETQIEIDNTQVSVGNDGLNCSTSDNTLQSEQIEIDNVIHDVGVPETIEVAAEHPETVDIDKMPDEIGDPSIEALQNEADLAQSNIEQETQNADIDFSNNSPTQSQDGQQNRIDSGTSNGDSGSQTTSPDSESAQEMLDQGAAAAEQQQQPEVSQGDGGNETEVPQQQDVDFEPDFEVEPIEPPPPPPV